MSRGALVMQLQDLGQRSYWINIHKTENLFYIAICIQLFRFSVNFRPKNEINLKAFVKYNINCWKLSFHTMWVTYRVLFQMQHEWVLLHGTEHKEKGRQQLRMGSQSFQPVKQHGHCTGLHTVPTESTLLSPPAREKLLGRSSESSPPTNPLQLCTFCQAFAGDPARRTHCNSDGAPTSGSSHHRKRPREPRNHWEPALMQHTAVLQEHRAAAFREEPTCKAAEGCRAATKHQHMAQKEPKHCMGLGPLTKEKRPPVTRPFILTHCIKTCIKAPAPLVEKWLSNSTKTAL